MFLNNAIHLPRTLAFRLTLWYAGTFFISSFLAFLIFYLSSASYIHDQADKEILEEIKEFTEVVPVQDIDQLKREVLHEAEYEDVEKMFIRMVRTDGSEIVVTDMSSWGELPISQEVLERLKNESEPIFATRHIPEKHHNVRVVCANIGHGVIMQTGVILEKETQILDVLKRIFSITMVVVFFLATVIGWFLARQALSGVEEVTRAAWQISRGKLRQRVPEKNRGQEVEQLASMFNHMLDQIQKTIQQMKEVNDNIAHDLKSPITRIRGTAEVTLMTADAIEEYRRMGANTIEECDNLLDMINTMLDISETEAGTSDMNLATIDMTELVRDICEMFEPLAEREGLRLTVDTPKTCLLEGDRKKLQRLAANLMDNAIKYSPPSKTISVSVSCQTPEEVLLTVKDTGIGISETDLPHIFERFYRCDRSRSKSGSGLGLSLVKAIVTSHNGNIQVESRPNQGSTFTVSLPR